MSDIIMVGSVGEQIVELLQMLLSEWRRPIIVFEKYVDICQSNEQMSLKECPQLRIINLDSHSILLFGHLLLH